MQMPLQRLRLCLSVVARSNPGKAGALFHSLQLFWRFWKLVVVVVYIVASIALFSAWDGVTKEKIKCDGLLGGYMDHSQEVEKHLQCKPRIYTRPTSALCLRNTSVLFVGDSRMRAIYYSFIDHMQAQSDPHRTALMHQNQTITFKGIAVHVDFLWNVFIDESWISLFRYFKATKGDIPDLIVSGAALWTLRGDPSHAALERYSRHVDAVLSLMSTLVSQPNTRVLWIQQAFINETVLSPGRKNMTNENIRLYNMAVARHWSSRAAPGMYLFNPQQLDLESDGVHYTTAANDKVVQVLLNVFCNSRLPVDDANLCCQRWTLRLNTAQLVLVLLFSSCAVVGIAAMVCGAGRLRRRFQNTASRPGSPSGQPQSIVSTLAVSCYAATMLGAVMLFAFTTDRTPLFLKWGKIFSWSSFGVPLAVMAVAGLLSCQTVKDASVLNRKQTCETRGWMQLVLLVYHYTGGSKVLGLYFVARLIVAMYVFLSAYGHFTHCLKHGASSWIRVVEILLRLNIFTALLCITMDVPYLHYYFVPLISACYLLVLGVGALPPAAWSEETSAWWQVAKVAVFAIIGSGYRLWPHAFNWLISTPPLQWLFLDDKQSLHEWTFRFGLDVLAIPSGMLCAILLHTFPRSIEWIPFFERHGLLMTVASALSMGIYVSTMAMFCTSKPQCNLVHTFISPTILATFVIMRNAWEPLRSRYSKFFDWVGVYSLELFIAQYHTWLANDTRSILVMVPGDETLNLFVVTAIFVLVSHTVAECTQQLVHSLLYSNDSNSKKATQSTHSTISISVRNL